MKYLHSSLYEKLWLTGQVDLGNPALSGSIYFGLGNGPGSIDNGTVIISITPPSIYDTIAAEISGSYSNAVSGSLDLTAMSLVEDTEYNMFLRQEVYGPSGSSMSLYNWQIYAEMDPGQFAGSGSSGGTLQAITDNGNTTTNPITVANCRASQNMYINYGGPDADSYLYFYEDSSNTGEYLKWDNANDWFEISDKLYINGPGKVNGTLDLVSNRLINLSNPTSDADGVPLQYLEAALSGSIPLTTKGDLVTFDTSYVRLPIGTDGNVLTADSTQSSGMKWGPAAGSINLQSVTDVGNTTTNDIVAQDLKATGDMYINYGGPDADSYLYFYEDSSNTGEYLKWNNASDKFEISDRLDIDGHCSINGTLDLNTNQINNVVDPTLDQDAATKKYVDDNMAGSPLTTKGDLFTYDTGAARLPVGTDGYVLTADSGETTGLKWATGGSSSTLDDVCANGNSTTREIFAGSLISNGNIAINYNGAEGDSYLYFYNGSDPSGSYLQWDDSHGFRFSTNTYINGSVVTTSGVVSGGDVYVNYDGGDGDSYLYFYDNSSPTTGYLKWDDAATGFKLSHTLNMNTTKITNAADPTAAQDVTTKAYVDTISGSLEVLGIPADGDYSDGLLSFTPATQVRNAIDDLNEVLAYLAPSPPDALSGTLTDNITTYSGKIAENSGLSLIDYSAGDTAVVSYNSSLTLTAPNSTKFDEADQSTLDCYMDDSLIESFDLASAFNESERAGDQSYPPSGSYHGYVYILTCGWYNDFPMWQRGTARLQIGATYGNSDLDGGEHNFKMVHGSDETSETQLYYDPESGRPANLETPTITENTPVYKYLSGIRYYYYGSTFDISGSCEKVFEYTYVDSPIRLTLSGMTTSYMAWNDGAVSGVHSPIPYWDDILGFDNKTITLNSATSNVLDARLTVTPRDPKGDGTGTQSASENRLIDTYATASTAVTEPFRDENRRLPSGSYDDVPGTIQGAYDSAAVLDNGNAQVIDDQLVYPSLDFSTGYLPSQSGTADYSVFTGDQVYFRAMYDATPHYAGSLDIGGITWDDLGVDVELEMRLPTETGWLDLSQAYDAGTFTGTDGDGVMTSHSQVGDTLTINWTVGSKTTANSGYMYILRITLHNTNEQITLVNEDGW